jgi:small subunit ribosomal protein S8
MAISDPVADMLTRIRNANERKQAKVVLPHSTLKEGILGVLKEEGYIKDYRVLEHPTHGTKIRELQVYLKYGPDNERVIRGLQRASKPGRRRFVGVEGIPKVLDGFGMAVLSTSRGILSSRAAKAKRTGGEILLTIW